MRMLIEQYHVVSILTIKNKQQVQGSIEIFDKQAVKCKSLWKFRSGVKGSHENQRPSTSTYASVTKMAKSGETALVLLPVTRIIENIMKETMVLCDEACTIVIHRFIVEEMSEVTL
jgi:hypothetical protein